MTQKKTAIILFNLGGPNSLEEVRPFLYNLFSDPAIITLPTPLRQLVAKLISSKRTPEATHIYEQLGGKSPLLENTTAQARALEAVLGEGFRCYTAMRYTAPRAKDVLFELLTDPPERLLLLPLYPQFSTTTTGSSLKEWKALTQDLRIPTVTMGCYPEAPGFIGAMADLTLKALKKFHQKPRLLLTAHGLPEKTIRAGDPYQTQVEITGRALLAHIHPSLYEEAVVCYQSRVGPLKWIEPYTDAEIKRAGQDGVPLCVVPIAFVSEHSETLVELDLEYGALAESSGVPQYERVPTVSTHPLFIEGLGRMILDELNEEKHGLRLAS